MIMIIKLIIIQQTNKYQPAASVNRDIIIFRFYDSFLCKVCLLFPLSAVSQGESLLS